MRRIEFTPEEARTKMCPLLTGRQPPIAAMENRVMMVPCVAAECMLWAAATKIISKSGDPNSGMDHSVQFTGKGYCSA
jgi:hypothetical protein